MSWFKPSVTIKTELNNFAFEYLGVARTRVNFIGKVPQPVPHTVHTNAIEKGKEGKERKEGKGPPEEDAENPPFYVCLFRLFGSDTFFSPHLKFQRTICPLSSPWLPQERVELSRMSSDKGEASAPEQTNTQQVRLGPKSRLGPQSGSTSRPLSKLTSSAAGAGAGSSSAASSSSSSSSSSTPAASSAASSSSSSSSAAPESGASTGSTAKSEPESKAADMAGKHQLNRDWSLWYSGTSAKNKGKDSQYSQPRVVCDFSTVEDFWAIFNNLKEPNQLVRIHL